MLSAIIGAIVGAVSSFIFTWILENKKGNRKKKNIAIAIVYELRMFKRGLEDNLKATSKKYVIFNAGSSDILYKTILKELPDYGSEIFLSVRSVYSQIRQINYLRTEFESVAKSKGSITAIPNLGDAYESSLKEALTNIDTALKAMKTAVAEKHFISKLPDIKHLTEIEKIVTDKNIQA